MALTKKTALEYMTDRGMPITAKELAIDLDSRASTASELLERITAQGLAQRDPKQRPREYVLTEAGRSCLQSSRATEKGVSSTSDRNLASDDSDNAEEDSYERLGGMPQKVHELNDGGISGSSIVEIAALYRARHEFVSRSWFSTKHDLQKQITALESQVGPQSAKKIEQLVTLERDLLRGHLYVTALHLRMQLSLAPDVLAGTTGS
jgi:DNA-binding MarR family transcriptional regulator